jgi:hypothetical protein
VRVEVKTWQPDECPRCAEGSSPVKPGSRSVAKSGGGA